MTRPETLDTQNHDAARIVHRIKPIRDACMRVPVMTQLIAEMSAERAVDAMVGLIHGARSGADAGYALALETLVVMLDHDEQLPYRTRASLYAAAKESGHLEIARLFFDASPNERTTQKRGNDGTSPAWQPTPRGRALTLGERKSLARAPRREVLRLVMRDPHPDVIHILLGNPGLTESDVLQIASRRPSDSDTLSMIARHPRWGARYPVKRALVQNPYTALHLALRLVTTMRAPDLRAIAHDEQLAPMVREQARALLDA